MRWRTRVVSFAGDRMSWSLLASSPLSPLRGCVAHWSSSFRSYLACASLPLEVQAGSPTDRCLINPDTASDASAPNDNGSGHPCRTSRSDRGDVDRCHACVAIRNINTGRVQSAERPTGVDDADQLRCCRWDAIASADCTSRDACGLQIDDERSRQESSLFQTFHLHVCLRQEAASALEVALRLRGIVRNIATVVDRKPWRLTGIDATPTGQTARRRDYLPFCIKDSSYRVRRGWRAKILCKNHPAEDPQLWSHPHVHRKRCWLHAMLHLEGFSGKEATRPLVVASRLTGQVGNSCTLVGQVWQLHIGARRPGRGETATG